MKIKRALISVWNKDGVVELGKFLFQNNIEILSTGGTKSKLEEKGVVTRSIGEITGSGSIMDGRVKTLHPSIFGGILADKNNDGHLSDLNSINGLSIDLVVVNFYPFVNEAVEKKLELDKAIEFIDVGGPSMIRAAAKNYNSVLPLCDPEMYKEFIQLYKNNAGLIPLDYRMRAASKVFLITSDYESAIYDYFNKFYVDSNNPPNAININLIKSAELRYGENPHQKAAFYKDKNKSIFWKQYQGKELSYNNYADIESAYLIVSEFSDYACSIIKHANPCGFGLGKNLCSAFKNAISADPVSYFGGIVGFNKRVDEKLAEILIGPFLECIVAPSYSNEALNVLKKKKNLRVISIDPNYEESPFSIRSIAGGYLYQTKDFQKNELNNLNIVTNRSPSNNELQAMGLGWRLVRHVKSNAVTIANKDQVLAVGAGQMSRVDAVKNAVRKLNENGLSLEGSILASDAFFPFFDSIEIVAELGIKGVIQPGGSIKDGEIIDKANELDITMAFTGVRHFLH